MNRFLILFILCPFLTSAVDLAGTWQGRVTLLVYGADVRLVMHFSKDSIDDTWACVVDVPDQGMKAEDVDVEMEGDSLTLRFFTFGGSYVARYNADSMAFLGQFKQSGFRLPMKMVKGDADDMLYVRPQKPKKPYPYYEEEVTIKNPASGFTLAGTFTRPSAKGKYPVAILISGSGAQDRDESLMGHKPFLILADYLTRRGFAVLRCDDRGTGKSTGDFWGNSADYAGDAGSQVEYLKTRKDVDKKRIGLIGHSEGGIVAPLVAADRKDIAFIVMLAGPSMDLFDILLEQQVLINKADGKSDAYIQDELNTNKQIYAYVRQSPDSASAADSIDAFLRSKNQKDYEIATALRQVDSRWMRFYINYDPVATLQKVKCPVLALNGEKDVQVPAEKNIAGIERGLKAGGNKDYKTYILPGQNHLFQVCKKCTVSEYVQLEETMSPKVLEIIGDWLTERMF